MSNKLVLKYGRYYSCEYLIGRKLSGDYGFGYMSHKGNCKYCTEHRKRELENLK